MTALGNSRTLLPVEYPLSSLTSWSDAAAAAAVGYNYPSSAPSAAHHLVYGGGRLANAAHPYSGPASGSLGVPDTSCSMYSSWRHHPQSPLSFYYQSEADWILRQSKLESQPLPFSHQVHHQQQLQQRWKVATDSPVQPRRDLTSTSTSTANTTHGGLCGLQFDAPVTRSSGSVNLVDNTSHDGSSTSCTAGLSPVIDAWTTTGRSSSASIDQYRCRGQGQGLSDMRSAPSHTGLVFGLLSCYILPMWRRSWGRRREGGDADRPSDENITAKEYLFAPPPLISVDDVHGLLVLCQF